ncbi:dihydrolipoyl dehydrogenase [Simiduia curdlanivorans]|uniref:Dihydrolipoyl dehydrogenase n=1 Tax=Simiduia curdlanivorans TaxID=1492769 RepID=A0ABV8V3D3_9GAMM|nr:dihydrolipoyl dehydrogenase [Simiduia curdlanivorans]MDN3638329.1 dihydrolipoyl dehydrogenase [Simiduia curdlanivorans]
MQTLSTDVAIIGAGTAGLAAYRAAREHTDKVLLIEGGPHGTTCARVGCMPSKLLIAAAEHAHHASHNGVFGVDYAAPKIDGKKVMQRVQKERDRFVGFVLKSVDSFPAQHKISGYATFVNQQQLQVEQADGTQLTINAHRIVIATGSSPFVPEFLKSAGDRLLINDDLFELTDLPQSVAVFGPGVIGLELGQALSRLGVKVVMFGASGSLGPLQDEKIRDYAHAQFNQEFYLDSAAKVEHISHQGNSVQVRYQHRDKGLISESFDYLLAATGRRANLTQLRIENADLTLDDLGVPVHDRYTGQCGQSPIFIAGDVSNAIPLLHEAADEGKIAGDNAGRSLKNAADVRAGLRRTPIGVVFTEPQIATVGLSLPQLKQRGEHCYAIGEVSFEDQGRSRVMHKNIGLLRVYGEQGTGLLLGAEMFGPAAEHIAHQLAWVIQMRMTVPQILDLPFYHPVIEEGVRTALRDLNHQLHIGPEMVEKCLDCGPGA